MLGDPVEELLWVEDGDGATLDCAAVGDEEPKFDDAVNRVSGVTDTASTMTTSPSMLVTLTSTVEVLKPLAFSKKL